MTQINWDIIPDATDGALRAADMLIRTNDGQERRTAYDGGWLYLPDATHTSENKQIVSANTQTLLTIDGLAEGRTTDFRRGVPLDVWDNNTIQPQATGETYEINLTFRASKATSSDTFVEIDVGIGADYSNIIARDRRALTKGSGIEDFVFFNGSLFVTGPFGAHGARFFINAPADVSIWEKALFIQRTHSP
jgi:hypothetical protein